MKNVLYSVKWSDNIGSLMAERKRSPRFEFTMLRSDWKKWDNVERTLLVPGFQGLSWEDAFKTTARKPFGGVYSFYANTPEGNFAALIANPKGDIPPSTQTTIFSFGGDVEQRRVGTSSNHYKELQIMARAKLGLNRYTTINRVYRPVEGPEIDNYKLSSLEVSHEDGDPYLDVMTIQDSEWTSIDLTTEDQQLFPDNFPPIQFPRLISKGVSIM